ncbi:MAG: holo-ACP synthase [Clostridiales bacterium]|nr:holo-ACP synthase [Clostridiales bacterium]
MIIGIGLDLCEISRMEQVLKNERFLTRFFTIEEQEYILSRGTGQAATTAACFAAKEALVKAFGTGFEGIATKDVAVLRGSSGKPYYELRGSAKLKAEELGVQVIHLSISHDGGIAAAFCVLEGNSNV